MLVIVTATCLGLAPAAHAQLLLVTPTEDLLFDADSQIDGDTSDSFGSPLTSGNVNTGTQGDLVAGDADGTRVLFGPLGPLVDIRTIGSAGFLINDSAVNGVAVPSSVAAGDVNGDGRDDVVSGLSSASPLGRTVAGAAYVVHGQDSSSTTNLDGPGAHFGFEIHGAGIQDQAGRSVAVADTNGDGLKDVIVGASGLSAAYVVFGKTNQTDVDLAALGAAGYKISPATGNCQTGSSVASAGDVNTDGREDILIGDRCADVNGGFSEGAAYVVFGKANATPVDLDTLGASGGYHIEGADVSDLAGTAVANAGDVNNDDRPDQVIGAPQAGTGLEGAAYVVFGKTSSSPVDLGALGSGGFEMSGAYPDDQTGVAVAGGRDFNGDGRSDVVVGADLADFNGRTSSGSAYVVYGKSSRRTVSLGGLSSSRGYRIDGPATNAVAGRAVASALSVTSNAGSDVIVGAPGNEANGRNDSGSVFVIDEGLQAARGNAPALLNVSLSLRSLVATSSSGRALAAAARRTTLRYRLRRRASVTLRLHRILTGRRSGNRRGRQRCRRSTRSLRVAKRRRCRRLVLVGRKIVRHRTRGRKSARVPTRLRGRRLKPGSYLLSVTARERNGREWGPAIARIRVKRK